MSTWPPPTVTSICPTPAAPLLRRYEERFHEPPDLHAAQSYDAARLLFEAMQCASAPSREALRKELAHQEEFDSVTGRVHWKDRQPRRRVFLMVVKNNQPKIVSDP